MSSLYDFIILKITFNALEVIHWVIQVNSLDRVKWEAHLSIC